MKTITLQVRHFPEELIQVLRVQAVTRGMSLRALLIELLQAATKKGK